MRIAAPASPEKLVTQCVLVHLASVETPGYQQTIFLDRFLSNTLTRPLPASPLVLCLSVSKPPSQETKTSNAPTACASRLCPADAHLHYPQPTVCLSEPVSRNSREQCQCHRFPGSLTCFSSAPPLFLSTRPLL